MRLTRSILVKLHYAATNREKVLMDSYKGIHAVDHYVKKKQVAGQYYYDPVRGSTPIETAHLGQAP